MKWYMKREKTPFSKINKIVDDPIISKILSTKEFLNEHEIADFLGGDIQDLFKHTDMEGLHEAARYLIDNPNKVVGIANDYDIDGTFGGFLLIKLMNILNMQYKIYPPHRVIDGYGLKRHTVDKAIGDGCEILITVDNGISSFEAVDYAKENNIFVIITDHHDLPTDKDGNIKLPNANLIINPKIGKYHFKHLCGAGVAFKLMIAVFKEKKWDTADLMEYLPFVAFATIGDVVELIGENRVIVKYGLPMMSETSNLGLNALISVNGLDKDKGISVRQIGFILGACINAAGRLSTIEKALDLLLTDDKKNAEELADELYSLNKKRQELTKVGLDRCRKNVVKEYINDKVLLLYDSEIHESVAGIIAGKLKDEFHKPTIVLSKSSKDGIAKGSARSIDDYDITNALSKFQDLLVSYGGHKVAAGVSINVKNIDTLRKSLNDSCLLSNEDLEPKIKIDTTIELKHLSLELAHNLTVLEPFGSANPKPLFGTKDLVLKGIEPLGKDGKHYKLSCIKDKEKQQFLLFFRADEILLNLKEKYKEKEVNAVFNKKGSIPIDLIYSISINEFIGKESVQTIIEDYRLL